MLRKLIRLKAEIRAQEAALNARQRLTIMRYDHLQTRYRNRLTSPSVLVTSFASGLITGTLVRRPRRDSRMPWLKLSRSIAGPALLYLLRTQAARWMHKAGL